jgi:hypothetical protein
MSVAASTRAVPASVLTVGQAILLGWLLCGVLDGLAAFALAWMQASRTPTAVLKGIASAVFGRAALEGGPIMVLAGLALHFMVALTATLVFYALSRHVTFLREGPLWLVGPVYGLVVLAAMNYATLPLASWARSFYFGTPARWPAGMGWPMVPIHMLFVGLPIAWSVRRAGR